ncbi:MAG: DUF1684 domain-containing protein [Ignavibacteriaceae bacterium]|nr:DUF1684 domain-containing protein [Ignavibacteriaceae bacterium]
MKSKIVLLSLVLFLVSCGKQYTPEQQKYIASIEQQRKEKDDSMKNDADSPFNQEPKQHFEPLKYYKVDPDFVFKSKLIEFESKDTISIYGTKGEERKVVRFGFVSISIQNKNYKMNVYNGTSRSGEKYYSIWFTDKTTGEETYGVGRYLDFELNADKDFLYTIDFNLAYSPYCSYSPKYSCAVPTKDDYLDIEVTAGEKKFHN